MLDQQLQGSESARGQRDARSPHSGNATPQRIEHEFSERVAFRWRVLDPFPNIGQVHGWQPVGRSKYRRILAGWADNPPRRPL